MKAIMRMFRVTMDVLLAVLLLTALAIVLPNLFGVKTLTVLSGSMEPVYPVGCIVYAAPVEPENISQGDPISYVLNKRGTVVTHRVVAVNREERNFTVRGDANDADDPQPVLYENVIGVVKFHIPVLGYALSFVLTTSGKVITGTVIAALILMTLLLGGGNETPEKGRVPSAVTEENVSARRSRKETPARTAGPQPEAGLKEPVTAKSSQYSREQRYIPKYVDNDRANT